LENPQHSCHQPISSWYSTQWTKLLVNIHSDQLLLVSLLIPPIN
jgi:hypothetical protein